MKVNTPIIVGILAAIAGYGLWMLHNPYPGLAAVIGGGLVGAYHYCMIRAVARIFVDNRNIIVSEANAVYTELQLTEETINRQVKSLEVYVKQRCNMNERKHDELAQKVDEMEVPDE